MKPNEVVEDKYCKGMYRLRWPDGVLSTDFYNWTRANDILNNYDYYSRNTELRTLDKELDTPLLPLAAPYRGLNHLPYTTLA